MDSSSNEIRQEVQSSEPVTMTRSLFGRPTGKSYRAAVAETIRTVKATYKLSNETLAEEIGCSESTVYNAENEHGDLAAVTLLNIAYRFGEEAVAPVRGLYLCTAPEKPTRAERFRRLHAELDALERDSGGLAQQAAKYRAAMEEMQREAAE
jgi:DNA-binding XRE family transcriptional regulator